MNTDPTPAQPETESNQKAKEKLKVELAVEKDRYLRLAADFDNFRRRTAQEMERRAAAQKDAFIRELLSVIDNLERALGAEATVEQLRHGVQITKIAFFRHPIVGDIVFPLFPSPRSDIYVK
jgi:molecular chaperone GrpE